MKDFDALLGVLDGLLEVQTELLTISRGKMEVVGKAKIKELENMTARENMLLKRLTKLDLERAELSGRIAGGKDATLAKLRELADDAVKPKLDEWREAFERVIGEQKRLTELNQKLIKTQLDILQFNINVFSSPAPVAGVYGSQGQEGPGAAVRPSFLDRQV